MTIQEYEDTLTQAQREAMRALQSRSGIPWDEFLAGARLVGLAGASPYVAIPDFHGMYVGIERDGYTHS